MPATFYNQSLQEACKAFRQEQTNGNLLKVAQALLNTQVMVPAQWDLEPDKDEKGALHFQPETKISLLVVTNPNKDQFIPVFTQQEEVLKLYGNTEVQCLIMNIEQYLPFLTQNPELAGIVVDPKGADVPFNTQFLEGVVKASVKGTAPLQQNPIAKEENILLQNPGSGIQDLEAELISSGYHEPAVKAIYLKERVEDKENPDQTHWFIVVDSDELDTGIFTRIGTRCKPVSHGKDMEFMFTNQRLGQDIAASSRPIYEKP